MANVDLNINVGVTPRNIFENISNQIKSLQGDIQGIGGAFTKVVGAFAAIKAAAGTFDFILDATRETEDLTKQFVRFTGSVEAAEDQLNQLRNIPGPSLNELAEANRTLLAFGSSTQESIKQLKQLNDVAAANGAKINDLADIYGKIQQEGTLTAETLKKMSKEIAGFSTDLAGALGVPEKSLKSLAEQGQITSDQVAEAFRKLTEAGGKYFGASERQAQTLTGSLSALNDAFTHLASSLGKSANPLLTKFINLLAEAAEGNARANEELEKLANENEAQKRIRAIGDELGGLTEKLKDLKAQQAEGFSFFGDDQIELTDKIDQVALSIQNLSRERLKLVKQEGLAETLKKDGIAAEEAQKKLDKLASDAAAAQAARDAKALDESVKAAEARGQALQAAEKNINKIIEQESAVRSQIMREQEQQALQDQRQAQETALLQQETAARDQLTGAQTFAAMQQAFLLEQSQETEDLLTKQKLDALFLREQELIAARVEAEAARLEQLGQFDEAEIIRASEKQRRLTELQKKADADRLADAQKKRGEEFNLFKQHELAKQRFEQETWAQRALTANAGLNALISLQKVGGRDAFNIGKAAAIAQAGIAIPLTAIEAYKSLAGIPIVGPALGAAAAAAAVVAGLAQLNQIRSQQMPAFAEGGIVPGSGNKDNVLSLLTPGEVVAPRKDFEDFAANLVEGSGSSDQINLTRQTNALLERILNEITFGITNEKLTTVIAVLNKLDVGIGSIRALQGSNTVSTETVKPILQEINHNRPATIDRRDLRVIRDEGVL